MDISLRELLRNLDDCIRRGNASLAREELHKMDLSRVPRPFAAPLAAIARRANLPKFALTLLHPYIREESGHPSEKESAEYAAALTYLGGTDEALEILKPLDAEKTPESLLYRSFSHFAQWDYASAIPVLVRYIKHPQLESYARMVGKLNLVSALVYEQAIKEAAPLIDELLEETGYPGHEFLRSSVLEISAQLNIAERNWLGAQKLLLEARASVRHAQGLQDLFVKKWRAVLDLRRYPVNDRSLAQLLAVKMEAERRSHFETVRDCDRYEALSTQNEALAIRLYFGTPFESFRRRMVSEFGKPLNIPTSYEWNLVPNSEKSKTMQWDLRSGAFEESVSRLAHILCSDFYCPFRVPALFFKLFRGNNYNPGASDTKVREVAESLRKALSKQNLPLRIVEENESLRIEGSEPISILVEQLASAA